MKNRHREGMKNRHREGMKKNKRERERGRVSEGYIRGKREARPPEHNKARAGVVVVIVRQPSSSVAECAMCREESK
jgi:hypothetical protein